MTIQEMKERKKELGYSNAMIAKLSGIPLGTVQKIFSGATSAPRYDTLRALEAVLKFGSASGATKTSDTPGTPGTFNAQIAAAGASTICETALAYTCRQQGEYTLEDYYNLPEDKRFELIDGVIYDMTAPSSMHQLIAGFFYNQFFNHITANKGGCLPMISPLDVQLDCDDRTMVQPDVIIVCDRSKVINRCVYGAPDFVLEVLSKSTRRKDMIIKLNKYMDAGVREYWMIDPEKQSVMIYDFANDNFRHITGFAETVPVAVLDHQCQIDLAALLDYIGFLYEK